MFLFLHLFYLFLLLLNNCPLVVSQATCDADTFCAAGSICILESKLCEQCEAGKKQFHNQCLTCDDGTGNVQGSTVCTDCLAGKFAELTDEARQCIDCPQGWTKVVAGVGSCIICPDGKYQSDATAPRDAVSSCDADCERGKQSNTLRTQCEICPKGKMSTSASTQCVKCPIGKYNNGGSDATLASNFFACISCPDGLAFNQTSVKLLEKLTDCSASDVSTACPAGKSTNADSSVCEICAAGTYNPISRQNSCTVCDAGKYITDDRSSADLHDETTDCIECEPGKSLLDAASNADKHNEESDCKVCGNGEYQTNSGQASCVVSEGVDVDNGARAS